MTDALEQVLRLVAEGRLTAEEAEPILAALDQPSNAQAGRAGANTSDAGPGGSATAAGAALRGRVARIQVNEGGRSTVDVRIPLSLGQFGLASIPGLGSVADRLREAVQRGETGPVLEVADSDGGGVRIVIE